MLLFDYRGRGRRRRLERVETITVEAVRSPSPVFQTSVKTEGIKRMWNVGFGLV